MSATSCSDKAFPMESYLRANFLFASFLLTKDNNRAKKLGNDLALHTVR